MITSLEEILIPVTQDIACSHLHLFALTIVTLLYTGRVVTARLGGGVKHLYHWVDYRRIGPEEQGQFYVEKVLQIITCGCRTAHVALVGGGQHLRYILATENMKAGDIIRTSMHIPKNAGEEIVDKKLLLKTDACNP